MPFEPKQISPAAAMDHILAGGAGTCSNSHARPWRHEFPDGRATRATRCRWCDKTLAMILGPRYEVR